MKTLLGLLCLFVLSGCAPFNTFVSVIQTRPVTHVVSADPAHGETIFRDGINGAPPCIGCHALTSGGFSLGPAMTGIRERAAQRIEGLDAAAYLTESILQPDVFLVPGYRSLMFTDYRNHLSDQDLDDLIAYLMTL
jgi:mono/diheme cytochrome c family protein